MTRSAYPEAMEYFEEALSALPQLPETRDTLEQAIDLRLTLRSVLHSLGETPNLAARLQGIAAPNTLVISAATVPLLGGFFACQSLGTPLLKGVAQPLEIYQVLSESTARSRLDAAGSPGLTPLISREPEVALLRERWVQVKEGIGQVVLLSTRSLGALVLWLLGYPDRALAQSLEAWMLAQEVAHPLSQVLAQVWLAYLHQFRQEAQAAHDWAAGSIAQAAQQGFSALYVAWGTVPQGWALTRQEQWAAGMAKLREGSDAALTTGSELWRPYFLALLAEAAGAAGQPEAGRRLLAEAQGVMARTDERFYEAELSRLTGVLHLAHSPAAQAGAEAHMRHALEIARHQEAKSLELRAAMSLSRLRKPARCSQRSTAGSPRASTPPTCRRSRPCSRHSRNVNTPQNGFA